MELVNYTITYSDKKEGDEILVPPIWEGLVQGDRVGHCEGEYVVVKKTSLNTHVNRMKIAKYLNLDDILDSSIDHEAKYVHMKAHLIPSEEPPMYLPFNYGYKRPVINLDTSLLYENMVLTVDKQNEDKQLWFVLGGNIYIGKVLHGDKLSVSHEVFNGHRIKYSIDEFLMQHQAFFGTAMELVRMVGWLMEEKDLVESLKKEVISEVDLNNLTQKLASAEIGKDLDMTKFNIAQVGFLQSLVKLL